MSLSLTPCPVCALELQESDLLGQREHMEQNHPEVIEERLKREGLWNWKYDEPQYPRENDPLSRGYVQLPIR